MNYCRKCQSDYEKPGTCNCFASSWLTNGVRVGETIKVPIPREWGGSPQSPASAGGTITAIDSDSVTVSYPTISGGSASFKMPRKE